MPDTVVNCPNCQRKLRVPDSLLGKAVKCPGCAGIFTAEGRGSPPPPPPRDDVDRTRSEARPDSEPDLPPRPRREPDLPAPSAQDRGDWPERSRPRPEQDEAEAGRPRRRRPRPDEEEDYDRGPDDYDEGYRRRRSRASHHYDQDSQRERASWLVRPPAIVLLVVALLGFGVATFNVAFALLAPPQPIDRSAPEFIQEVQKNSQGPTAAAIQFLFVMLNSVIALAAIQMIRLKTHWFAITGSVLAMFNCGSLCCLLGLPIGIWSLIMLLLPGVRDVFDS